MIRLTPYDDPNLAGLLAIFAAKRGKRKVRLANATARVVTRCENYTQRSGRLTTIVTGPFGPRVRRDLLHCYDVRSAKLDELKARVFEIQPDAAELRCQYCDINSWRDLDHYLPRQTFHEFSVFASNLVPCCADCNNLKGTRWLTQGRRHIVSLYFDHLPRRRYLFATVTFDGGVFRATFRLSGDARRYAGMKGLVWRHFRRLKLLRRYTTAAVRYLSEQRIVAKRYAATHSRAQTSAFLAGCAEDLRQARSPNHWKACLLAAAARCPEFCLP